MDEMGTGQKKPPQCIHLDFHEQAAKTPDAACIIDVDNQTLSYADVQVRVLELAQELVETAGAGPNRSIGIFMEASADYVISMLAILTAGAGYVPLELNYPIPMLQRVLHDATPVAVLTTSEQKAMLPHEDGNNSVLIICVDDAEHRRCLHNDSTNDREKLLDFYKNLPTPSLDDLAFVVYSSGTTGQPKGIANPHRAPALSYHWRFTEISDYGEGDRVACNVFFVWEALRPVMRGGAVVPIPSDIIYDADALSMFLQSHQITEMLFTPSLLDNVMNLLSKEDLQQRLSTLKTVFLNGEVVSIALRERCYRLLPNTRFVNLYSVSECHEVGAMDLRDVDMKLSAKFCPTGPPCSISPVYVLDEDQQPVKDNDAGELYVGGDMLAIGYLNLPQLTATRFVPDPFRGGGEGDKYRMYRTGDRARMLPNGQLEILGRCDFMVKIRGYSIVLGAVEAALVEAVALSSCVVVADGEETTDKHLVAYLVRAPASADENRLVDWSIDNRTGSCPEIRHAVDGILPHYMVPSVYIEVETLPVSAVGAKLDRKALQAQSSDRRAMLRSLQLSADTHIVSASTPRPTPSETTDRWPGLVKYLKIPPGSPVEDVEAAIAMVWEAVLGRDSIPPDADFHEQGGHSLLAGRLVSSINKIFSTQLSAVQIMQGTTIRKCVKRVLSAWKKIDGSSTDGSGALRNRNGSKEVNGVDHDDSMSGETASTDASAPDDDEAMMVFQKVREDAVLPETIVPEDPDSARGLNESRAILLTGATGFFGAHILAEVLRTYEDASVTCLVRSANKDAIRKNMEQYKLWKESFSPRITEIKGDLSVPLFGLSQTAFERLASVTDAVIHCGAVVSLTAPYSHLCDPNVKGTLEIIKLACACKAGTPLVYVSSNGIFPRDDSKELFLENDDVACLPNRLGAMDGYGLSKWAAEQLIIAAHKRGLNTVTIRYGNIGWQSKSGIHNSLDFQGMMLNGSRRLGARPRIENWMFEVTPVDLAAKALVALAEQTEHAGAIFNCVQSELVDAEQVFGWVCSEDGIPIPALSFSDWTAMLMGNEDPELSALKAFAMAIPEGERFFSRMAHLDCSKFDQAISKVDPPLSRLSSLDATADYYRAFLLANAVLPISIPSDIYTKPLAVDLAATEDPVGPLAGKVAIVTGASSGIGRAIVLALVRAGASVAMGARRLKELEQTQKLVADACSGSSAKTMCVRCDVTQRSETRNLVRITEASLGPCDILVNCAGVMYFTLMKNVQWDQWDRQVDVNCKGTMYGIGCVLPGMLQRGAGHIVNITSDAGRKAFPGLGVYSGSKFFLEAVSQALRAETASTGLRVTCIQPGNVETPLLSISTDPEGLQEYGTPTGAKVLEPADIGRAVVYAVTQPEWCAVNEILVEPREEPA